MVEWAHAFDAPVYIHEADREWVARPDDSVVFWEGETREIGEGLTLVNAGVHFDGGQVLHWRDGEDGRGALMSGDIFTVVQDRSYVSFMYSYPNLIPERPRTIRRALRLLEPYPFERVYGAWWGRVVPRGRGRGRTPVGGPLSRIRAGRRRRTEFGLRVLVATPFEHVYGSRAASGSVESHLEENCRPTR